MPKALPCGPCGPIKNFALRYRHSAPYNLASAAELGRCAMIFFMQFTDSSRTCLHACVWPEYSRYSARAVLLEYQNFKSPS